MTSSFILQSGAEILIFSLIIIAFIFEEKVYNFERRLFKRLRRKKARVIPFGQAKKRSKFSA